MPDRLSVVNGQFVPADRAAVGIGDLGVQRGYGVFDYFRTRRGRPIFWADHLDRLDRSTAELRLPLPGGRAALLDLLRELVRRNAIDDSGVRVTVTGGDSPDGYSIAAPNVLVTQTPLADVPNPAPLRLVTRDHQRQFPRVKTTDYLMAVWLRPEIAARNADDALYHAGGLVRESPRANAFFVDAAGTLVTPAAGVLEGVTRRRVLELAAGRLPVAEREVPVDELPTVREAFLTGTSRGIAPVSEIDGRPVGGGRPGEATRLLMRLLAERVEAEADAAG